MITIGLQQTVFIVILALYFLAAPDNIFAYDDKIGLTRQIIETNPVSSSILKKKEKKKKETVSKTSNRVTWGSTPTLKSTCPSDNITPEDQVLLSDIRELSNNKKSPNGAKLSFPEYITRFITRFNELREDGKSDQSLIYIQSAIGILTYKDLYDLKNSDDFLIYADLIKLWASILTPWDTTAAFSQMLEWLEIKQTRWYFHAPDVLVDILAQLGTLGEGAGKTKLHQSLPNYWGAGQSVKNLSNFDTFLWDALSTAVSDEAHKAFVYMVYARASEGDERELFLQDAILTGYSYPLAYLLSIEHLISEQREDEAFHIYELYRLAVIHNIQWCKPNGSIDNREREVIENRFKDPLQQLNVSHPINQGGFPNKSKLNSVLEYWPDRSKDRLIYLLFTKALTTKNWPRPQEDLIDWVNSQITDNHLFVWDNEGRSQFLINLINDSLKRIGVTLPSLYAQQARIINQASGSTEAITSLEGKCWGGPFGTSTQKAWEQVMYYLIASYELKSQGAVDIQIHDYPSTLKLIEKIRLSCNADTLNDALRFLRLVLNDSPSDETESVALRVYKAIDNQLTSFNPTGGGMLSSSPAKILHRALTEAKERNIFPEEISDLDSLIKTYNAVSEERGHLLQLFHLATKQADIEEITGLFIEMQAHINDQSIPIEATTRWLLAYLQRTPRDNGIFENLNTLEDVRSLVESSCKKKGGMKELLAQLRKLRTQNWLENTSNPWMVIDEPRSTVTQTTENPDTLQTTANATGYPVVNNEDSPSVQIPSLLDPASQLPYGYSIFNPPGDNLCMYRSLADMYGVFMVPFIRGMFESLTAVHTQIQENALNGVDWSDALTEEQLNQLEPLSTDNAEYRSEGVLLPELEELLVTLLTALKRFNEASPDELATFPANPTSPGAAWGTETMLNTAAVVLQQLLAERDENFVPFVSLMPSINAAGTAYMGSLRHRRFMANGQAEDVNGIPVDHPPLLVHINSNHWISAIYSSPQSRGGTNEDDPTSPDYANGVPPDSQRLQASMSQLSSVETSHALSISTAFLLQLKKVSLTPELH